MNTQRDNAANTKIGTTLSNTGSAILAATGALLCILCAVCMRTDAQGAVLSLLIPLFIFSASYILCALAVHKKYTALLVGALATSVAAVIFTAAPLRCAVAVFPFAVGAVIGLLTQEKRLSCTGAVILASCAHALCFIVAFCIMSIEKYGHVGTDTFVSAYESFVDLVMVIPEMNLEMLNSALTDPAYAGIVTEDVVKEYALLTETLRELLGLFLYKLLPIFLSVCSIGGFITMIAVKRHRRMQSLPDTLGAFEMSVVSAVLYILLTIAMLLVDPYSAIGITIDSVSSVVGLGLALVGIGYLANVIKASDKKTLYTVILVGAAAIFPSILVGILSIVGASNVITRYVREKIKNANRDE